jgi:hypothetical protein
MKLLAFVLTLLLVFCGIRTSAQAQNSSTSSSSVGAGINTKPSPDEMRRRMMLGENNTPLKSYPDSVEFLKAFNAFYPLIAPKEKLVDRVSDQFKKMYPAYKSRGVDSLAAWKQVLKDIDTTHDRNISFRGYRQIFSAEDMKEYAKFMKTPTGKKLYEGQQTLSRTTGQSMNYPMMLVSSAMRSLDKSAPPQMGQMQRPNAPGAPRNAQIPSPNSIQIAPAPPAAATPESH